MTRDELFELLGFLECIKNYECIACAMLEDECERLIELVKKDIDSKEQNDTSRGS